MIELDNFSVKDYKDVLEIFKAEDFGCVGELEFYKPNLPHQELVLRSILRGDSDESIVVCRDNDKTIGYSYIQDKGEYYHIAQIAVKKEYQRNGIGKLLIDDIKDKAKANNMGITLECFDNNNRFFSKCGFTLDNSDNIMDYYSFKEKSKFK